MDRECDQFLWTERYRPKKVKDVILPESLKIPFQKYVDQGASPNLLLCGSPGTGKSTIAKAMLHELGAEVYEVNGSLDANKNTLRNEIQSFATNISFTGGRKYVLIDEADYLDMKNVQTGLRSFMETCADNCGFILTCNFPSRLMDAIRSRLTTIDFKILNKDKPKLASQFMHRCEEILKGEGVDYDQKAIVEIIKRTMPDWRQILVQLQHFSSFGKIDVDNINTNELIKIDKLMKALKTKNWTDIRKWVNENPDMDQNQLFDGLFKATAEYLSPDGDAVSTMVLAKYQEWGKNSPNPKINMLGCLVEFMVETEDKWKDA